MSAQILQHPDPRPIIPVIDLFAGPGGLGEGFSAHTGLLRFNVSLSVEKNQAAHSTLQLRSFIRQFPRGLIPDEYYAYVRDRVLTREQLFARFPDQAARARSVAWLAELGKEPQKNVLQRIREAIGDSRHWVLLGGPPCQAYSVIGRARMSKMKKFADDHRHTLYREYLKIVAAFQPTVFVMENVKGILSSKHKNEAIFERILRDLRDPWAALPDADRRKIENPGNHPKYRVYSFSTGTSIGDEELNPEDYLIESERYSVPQRRHRVILLGIRDDYDVIPPVLEKAKDRITVRHMIEGMPAIRSRLSSGDRNGRVWRAAIRSGLTNCSANCRERFWGLGTIIRKAMRDIPDSLGAGGPFVPGGGRPERLAGWIFDTQLGGVLQHEARSHMASDLHRYLFSTCFAKKYSSSPKLDEFPEGLLPEHENAVLNESGKVANFSDRFRVQLWDDAATTVTSHIAKDGHYFIHPDSHQCRSLTVREAARLQTFPDNYYFEGNRTEQYQQVGNAVPPYLAYQLAGVVDSVLLACMKNEHNDHSVSVRT